MNAVFSFRAFRTRRTFSSVRAARAFCVLYGLIDCVTLSHANAPDRATLASAQQQIAKRSVPFVPNAGQWDARAAFAAQTFAGTLFVTKTGELVYSLPAFTPLSPGGSSPSSFKGDSDRLVASGSGSGMGFGGDLFPQAIETHPHPRPPREVEGAIARSRSAWSLTETLVDAHGQPRIARLTQGIDPTPTRVSFHTTDAVAAHKNGLNAYERVSLGEMYPGVTVELRATQTNAGNNVEKIFTVAPHQDPKQIQIKLSGATKLEIGKQGELIAHTGNGPVAFTAPIAFQEDEKGARIPVEVAYALSPSRFKGAPSGSAPFKGEARRGVVVGSNRIRESEENHPHPRPPLEGERAQFAPLEGEGAAYDTYTFTLGSYDPTRPLVIDPLLASTYLGGPGFDQITAMAIHPASGEVYVAGTTSSPDFPQTLNGGQSSATGTSCFISRYSADLSRLIQSSYVGNGDMRCTSLAFNAAGDAVYVAGWAYSTATFPAGSTNGAIQATHANAADLGARTDGFVARLSVDLRSLTKATFFGGNGAGQSERINAIAVHPQTGFVHIVGTTDSATLPGVLAGTQAAPTSLPSAFTARLAADLMGPAVSTVRYALIGGTGSALGYALAIDPRSGDVFMAGSSTGGLPAGMLGGAAQAAHAGGGGDAFVARLKQDLSTVVRATYLGGSGNDEAQSIALHPLTGEVVVAGYTTSSDLTQTAGAAQSANNGGRDGFVSRVSADLTAILQTSYLGGTGDECNGSCTVAIHPQSGEVFVAGDTNTGLAAALVVDGIQPGYAGGQYDGFVVRLNAALTQRRAGTHLGGGNYDIGYAVAIEPSGGSVYLAGVAGPGFPTVNAQQSTYNGLRDGFVSRLSIDLTAVNRIPNPFSFIPQSNVPPNATRTSNEVQLIVTPTPPNNQQSAYVVNAPGTTSSELCIANQPGICVTPYVGCASPCFGTNWFPGPWDFVSGDYIAVRHLSASSSGTAETKLIISGQAYPFRTSTGNANIACNLDMNGDNQLAANVEGLILVRAMLGFNTASVVNGTGVTQSQWDAMRPTINANCGTNF